MVINNEFSWLWITVGLIIGLSIGALAGELMGQTQCTIREIAVAGAIRVHDINIGFNETAFANALTDRAMTYWQMGNETIHEETKVTQ